MNYWGKKLNAPPNALLSGLGNSAGILPSSIPEVVSVQNPQPKHNFPTYTPPDSLLAKPKRKKKSLPDISPAEPEPKPFVPYDKPKADAPKERPDPEKEFLKAFKKLTYRFRSWDVWRDFVTMFACALSNAIDKSHFDEREALYLTSINKYNKEERMLFPELIVQTTMALEDNPEQDFLGKIYMRLNLGSDARGQFFTPYHVAALMARCIAGDVAAHVKEHGYYTIHNPCCGAGGLLIAGIHEARRQLEKAGMNWQYHVLVVAQDIDYIAALMCYIQLSLLGVAAYVKVGNSLTDPMTANDTLENYWFTLMYFHNVWVMRRFIRGGMQRLFEEPAQHQNLKGDLQK